MSHYSHTQDMAQSIADDVAMTFEALANPLTDHGASLMEAKRRILAKSFLQHALDTPNFIVDSPFNTERSK